MGLSAVIPELASLATAAGADVDVAALVVSSGSWRCVDDVDVAMLRTA